MRTTYLLILLPLIVLAQEAPDVGAKKYRGFLQSRLSRQAISDLEKHLLGDAGFVEAALRKHQRSCDEKGGQLKGNLRITVSQMISRPVIDEEILRVQCLKDSMLIYSKDLLKETSKKIYRLVARLPMSFLVDNEMSCIVEDAFAADPWPSYHSPRTVDLKVRSVFEHKMRFSATVPLALGSEPQDITALGSGEKSFLSIVSPRAELRAYTGFLSRQACERASQILSR